MINTPPINSVVATVMMISVRLRYVDIFDVIAIFLKKPTCILSVFINPITGFSDSTNIIELIGNQKLPI